MKPGYLLACLTISAAAFAGTTASLSPETYVEADIAARQATLDGMTKRLAVVKAGTGIQAEMAALSDSQAEVAHAYAKYGTDMTRHTSYATRHGEEIEAWLAAHPAWQSKLWQLEYQFMDLSRQFDLLRGEQQ